MHGDYNFMVKNSLKRAHFKFASLLCIFLFTLCRENIAADPFIPNLEVIRKDASPYRFSTERFLEVHPYDEVDTTLQKQGIRLKQKKFYDSVVSLEERGHMGYHASSHQFRVFQDIIRIAFEELLGLEFKKDFYFFRIPRDPNLNNHRSAGDFLAAYKDINDNLPEQRDQLISINFTLFSNFRQKYECTSVFFEKAISYKPPNFEDKISLLFEFLGMPQEKIHELFEIGKIIEHPEGGTLFQFFDFTHHLPSKYPYDLANRATYFCKKKGVPISTQWRFSDLYEDASNSDFFDQYRIVANDFEVLNPYSSLWIRRYDLNSAKNVNEYEKKLRNAIRTIPYDRLSADVYKRQLKYYWKL
jgi:hypothetical protein